MSIRISFSQNAKMQKIKMAHAGKLPSTSCRIRSLLKEPVIQQHRNHRTTLFKKNI